MGAEKFPAEWSPDTSAELWRPGGVAGPWRQGARSAAGPAGALALPVLFFIPSPPPRSDPKASDDCPAGKGCLLGSRTQLPYFELGCVSPFLERTPSPHASFLGMQTETVGRPSSVPLCDSVYNLRKETVNGRKGDGPEAGGVSDFAFCLGVS